VLVVRIVAQRNHSLHAEHKYLCMISGWISTISWGVPQQFDRVIKLGRQENKCSDRAIDNSGNSLTLTQHILDVAFVFRHKFQWRHDVPA
jgi:hypothetical protein